MRRAVVAAAVVALFGTAGCSREATDTERRLRAAIDRTEHLAHRFSYTEVFKQEHSTRETTVRGLVEDDFRYKAAVRIGGAPILEETVSDDSIAVRFLQPALLGDFGRRPEQQRRGGTGVGANDADAPETASPVKLEDLGPDPVEALRSRRWVLDPAGAPATFEGTTRDRTVGQDPILDARDVFAYVRRAINEAARVVEFNEDSLEYRRSEDPFERPEQGSGVIRYDFIRPDLPKASDRSPGGNQITPDTRHFRKLAVYVKDNQVIRVAEDVDVESRLKDLSEVYDTKFPEDLPDSQVAAIAVDALNAIRTGQGDDPIRHRTMDFRLFDLGVAVTVEMPADAVETSLAVLQNRGRAAHHAAGAVRAAEIIRRPAPAPSG